uniref:StAR related lipid transfer domain containing 13 n=1 Tax=Propithecus coquereli TaxID=379532 RepID=A0A2K6EV76_PROCO
MTSKRRPFQTQLRRSISEQLRDSTARAWDLLWKNVRERRLAGLSPELGNDRVWKKVLERKKV